jgi:tellurite resistance protein
MDALPNPVEAPADVLSPEERALIDEHLPVVVAAARIPLHIRTLLGVKTNLGLGIASRLLGNTDGAASEVMRARAKLAFVELGILCVTRLANELGKRNPRKHVVQSLIAVLRLSGIATDTVPVTPTERKTMEEEARSLAGMSKADLTERVSARLDRMKQAQAVVVK